MREHNYEHWIETYTGHPFDPLNPDPLRVCIMDIAHSLSNQCRFSGHTNVFYSVAQHSVHVSEEVESMGACLEFQLLALFHDASEAYLQDMPTPIKRQMPTYREAEKKVQAVIEKALFPEMTEEFKRYSELTIKQADLILLATEARDLMNDPKDWASLKGIIPRGIKINPWTPEAAKKEFFYRNNFLLDALAKQNKRS